jgi:hypothetical protein
MFTIGNVMIEEWQRTACPTSIPNKISISDLSVSNPWIGWFVWNRQSLQADDVRGEWVPATCRAHWTCCSTCPWLPPQAWSPYRYIYLSVCEFHLLLAIFYFSALHFSFPQSWSCKLFPPSNFISNTHRLICCTASHFSTKEQVPGFHI